MSVFLSPLAVILQFFTDQGIVLSGGKIWTYEAGTDNPAETFTDITGTVVNPNPIRLDESGRLPTGTSIWQTGGQALKAIFQDSAGVPIGQPIDQIGGINDTTSLTPLITQLVNDAVAGQDTQFFTNLINSTLSSTITQAYLGGILYPQTQNERAAQVTPVVLSYQNGPYRYGAKGDGFTDDSAAWNLMGKVSGIHIIQDGTFFIKNKIQTFQFASLHGWTRQNTVLQSGGIANNDYMLEIGKNPTGPNPNVGLLERVRFIGATNDAGCLHMNQGSHMWRLNELLFQSSPCPGLVIDFCEDSNYSNIDMLSVGNASNASLIVKNGSNNIYFRGLRIEQGPGGCMSFVGSSSIFIDTGKCDQGFIAQSGPIISIDSGSQVSIDNYTIQGANAQYPIICAGTLTLGNVLFEGGTNTQGHIYDNRAWDIVNANNPKYPGVSVQTWGPYIPPMELGSSRFYKFHPSVSNSTPAAVTVVPASSTRIRLQGAPNTFTVVSSITQGPNAIVGTAGLPSTINNQWAGCFLVHNPTGTRAIAGDTGSRRLILQSFVGGNLLVQGPWGCTADGDWSLEFSGGHNTQVNAENVKLEPGMTLFSASAPSISNVSAGISINPSPAAAYSNGQTVYNVTNNSGIPAGTNLQGYYLVDDVTGEPYQLSGGLDSSNNIAVFYDTTGVGDPGYTLNTSHSFSLYSGYYGGVKVEGDSYVWDFAGIRKKCSISYANSSGFDQKNIPLWGCGTPSSGFTTLFDSANFSPGYAAPFTYEVDGNMVTLTLTSPTGLTGTSTTSSFKLTGLPFFLTPKNWHFVSMVGLVNGGAGSIAGAALVQSTGAIVFYLSVVGSSVSYNPNTFATSGQKGLSPSVSITYPLS